MIVKVEYTMCDYCGLIIDKPEMCAYDTHIVENASKILVRLSSFHATPGFWLHPDCAQTVLRKVMEQIAMEGIGNDDASPTATS